MSETPEPDAPQPETDPARLALLHLAEQEAERLSALMGPAWADGMYD